MRRTTNRHVEDHSTNRRMIEDDDEDDFPPLPPAVSRYRRAARRNPFIETEAGVDGDASAEKDDDDADDLDGFIVADDVF